MCDKSQLSSFMCIKLGALQRMLSRNPDGLARKYDFDCYQMYKRSETINTLMDLCRQNKNQESDLILATECLLIKEWASVLAVYSTSGRTLSNLPIAMMTNCDPKQEWSSDISASNYRCAYQKIEFFSECSLSLAKQENQT